MSRFTEQQQVALDRLARPFRIAATNNFSKAHNIRGLGDTVNTILKDTALTDDIFTSFKVSLKKLFPPDFDSLPAARRVELIRQATAVFDGFITGSGAPQPAEKPASRPAPSRAVTGQRPKPVGEPAGHISAPKDKPKKSEPASRLLYPVTVLGGVGPKMAEAFAAKEIHTVGDLLFFFPRRYEDRRRAQAIRELHIGEEVIATGRIIDMEAGKPARRRGARSPFNILVGDDTGTVLLSWFRYGGSAIADRYGIGDTIRFSGKISSYGRFLQIVHPSIEPAEADPEDLAHPIKPVYAEVPGIPRKTLRRAMRTVTGSMLDNVVSVIPPEFHPGEGLDMPLATAVGMLHQPPDDADIDIYNRQKSPAHRRVALENLFVLQAALAWLKQRRNRQHGRAFEDRRSLLDAALRSLPWGLTGAQSRSLQHIIDDLTAAKPMHRLLQGDVGSGKTVVATLAALVPVANGAQAAMMVPTEILARQHYAVLRDMLDPLGVSVGLLTGSLTAARARSVRSGIETGAIDVVVGTHALIQGGVNFKNLGFVVIDEQHRFGVGQRTELRGKGAEPDLLVMTATPIPRSMALTLYGDLDLSVIDEMPPGRKAVHTELFMADERDRAYSMVRHHVDAGHQVYIVYPLVEESEKLDAHSAVEMYQWLQQHHLSGVPMGLVHGRMSGDEKDAVIAAFRRGDIRVLVSTTVIEVGVDVPKATVMTIENADRFGLSQLHQLRGRVGRGGQQGYCYLITGAEPTDQASERLEVMVATTDGFVIAERDLEIRGPGEFIGTRQSGLPDQFLSDMLRHGDLLEPARRLAADVLKHDPPLAAAQHRLLKEQLLASWGARLRLTESG